jgi:phospholipid transport system substrate-binding protein
MDLKRRFTLLLFLAAAISGILGNAVAVRAANAGAEVYIRDLGNETLRVLAHEDRSQARLSAEVRPLLSRNLDIETVSRIVLSRYWRTATEAQRNEFKKLLFDYIVAWFSGVLVKYSGEELVVRASRPEGENAILVSSVIERPNAQPARVDWRVRSIGNSFKIYDVVVEGVSMALTYQQEFGAVLQKNNGRIDALLDALRKRIAEQS